MTKKTIAQAQADARKPYADEIKRMVATKESLLDALDLAMMSMLEYGRLGVLAADGKSVMAHCQEARKAAGRSDPLHGKLMAGQ